MKIPTIKRRRDIKFQHLGIDSLRELGEGGGEGSGGGLRVRGRPPVTPGRNLGFGVAKSGN